jgi:hypothetical protein
VETHSGILPGGVGRMFHVPLTLLAVLACGAPESPTPYARGQAIPLGGRTLKVRSVEALSVGVLAGFSDFRVANPSQAQVVAIHVEIDAGPAPSGGTRDFEDELRVLQLMLDFQLRDGQGSDHRFGMPLSEPQFRVMKSHGSLTPDELGNLGMRSGPQRNWVLLFAVPRASSDFTLRISNRRPQQGEPRLAAVALGR